MPIKFNKQQTIVELRTKLMNWERRSSNTQTPCISTGCGVLDMLFPAQGISRGGLVEWIGDDFASGSETISLLVGRQLLGAERPAIIIDYPPQVSPRGLASFGFDLSKIIVIRPRSEQDALWACEEALRCKAASFVWTRLERLSGIAFRRLQLATEESSVICFLIRPPSASRQPSWADVRLLVSPRPSQKDSPRFQISVLNGHGRTKRSSANIEIDAVQGAIREVSIQNETHCLRAVS